MSSKIRSAVACSEAYPCLNEGMEVRFTDIWGEVYTYNIVYLQRKRTVPQTVIWCWLRRTGIRATRREYTLIQSDIIGTYWLLTV